MANDKNVFQYGKIHTVTAQVTNGFYERQTLFLLFARCCMILMQIHCFIWKYLQEMFSVINMAKQGSIN